MFEIGFCIALEFRDDSLRQHLAEFNSPLIERVNIPNDALRENRVFVKSHELTQYFRRELVGKDRVRWPVALENPMRHEPIRRALRFHLLRCLTKSECLGLSEHICQEHVVMPSQRIEGLGECDEIARNEFGSLMNQLVEGMLSVCSGLAPIDRASFIFDWGSLESYVLPVALHRQLLHISREPFQVLLVR